MFRKKAICSSTGSGAKPQKLGIFENFCVKSNLKIRLLLTISYTKIGGAGCTSCSTNNFVGEAGSFCFPVPFLPVYLRH